MNVLIKIGGVYYIICAVNHLIMPSGMKWMEILEKLKSDPLQYSYIMSPLYIMNWVLVFAWLAIGIIWLAYPGELVGTGIGKFILISLSLFWVIRIAVLQSVYIGYSAAISYKMAGFFMVGLIITVIVLVHSFRTN